MEGREEEPGIIAPQKVIIIPRVIKMDANEDMSLNDRRKKMEDDSWRYR